MGRGSPPNSPVDRVNYTICGNGQPYAGPCRFCPTGAHVKCPNGICYGQQYCDLCPPYTHNIPPYPAPRSSSAPPASPPGSNQTPPPKPSPAPSSYHTPEPSRLRQAIDEVLRNLEPVPELPPFPARQEPEPGRTFLDLPNHYLFDVIIDLRRTPDSLPGHMARPTPIYQDNLSIEDSLPSDLTTALLDPMRIHSLERAGHLLADPGVTADLLRYVAWTRCIDALDGFLTHINAIRDRRSWERREISNRLINADIPRRLIPFTSTPYYARVPSPEFPTTLPTQLTTVPAPGTPSPAPIPIPNAPPRQPRLPRQP
jgi:hypothetical protein